MNQQPLDIVLDAARAYLHTGVDKRCTTPYGPAWRDAGGLRAEARARYMGALQAHMPQANYRRVPW